MLIRINFKSPDSVEDAIEDCASDNNELADDIRAKLGKFIKYGEYCLVEFDLGEGTAKVVPVQ